MLGIIHLLGCRRTDIVVLLNYLVSYCMLLFVKSCFVVVGIDCFIGLLNVDYTIILNLQVAYL